MNAEYWKVGATAPSALPLTPAAFTQHLVADWVPSLPASVGASLLGWPSLLTETVSIGSTDYVTLKEVLGRTERQWKGMLSWMMGVVGTRHVLQKEGYRWVAPLSAFYPEARQGVDLSSWHPSYPPSILVADKDPKSKTNLRPDYIALRPNASTGRDDDWAVAESKGTSDCLTNRASCRKDWSKQVRNVKLTCSGTTLKVPRHLVVATRCNPNAKHPETRRVQIRAWNSEEDAPAPPELGPEVAAAHLFGVCRNIGLRENALALALSTEVRREMWEADRPRLDTRRRLSELSERAAAEVDEFRVRDRDERYDYGSPIRKALDTEAGRVTVEIDAATVSLISALRSAVLPEQAIEALQDADARLDERRLLTSGVSEEPGVAESPAGIRVELPRLLRG